VHSGSFVCWSVGHPEVSIADDQDPRIVSRLPVLPASAHVVYKKMTTTPGTVCVHLYIFTYVYVNALTHKEI